ncbi:hypothetical protein DB31_4841 [Hyalangium minutum]|uniref:Uncharacterized protein n=1 Tax=Hyalangium minutum TaxID=394096 RepID=A0A085VYZ6_9BACT|nr:hypothetical protein DB31_4841 [Hyalangium minutum]
MASLPALDAAAQELDLGDGGGLGRAGGGGAFRSSVRAWWAWSWRGVYCQPA